MKKEELELVLNKLEDVKQIADRQEYVVSKSVNQIMNEIRPILNTELKRMDLEGVECNAPQIGCFTALDLSIIQEMMNTNLEQLIKADYKIIDYSITLHNTITKPNTYSVTYLGVIKYTT